MSHSILNSDEQSNTEQWRDVPGYEGRYMVSDQGRVYSLYNPTTGRKGRILSPALSSGYPYVHLFKNAKGRVLRVHRLVAAAFIGPCPQGGTVNHKDCDKTNNRLENLEYLTIRDNVRHAAARARHGTLTVSQVQEIREMHKKCPTISMKETAKKFGVGLWVIKDIVRARTYANVPDSEGNLPKPISTTSSRYKLSGVNVFALHSNGQSMGSIARQYHVTTGAVSKAYHKMLRTQGLG